MKFYIHPADLKQSLSLTVKAITNSSIPVLGGVLIDASDKLTITGTNLQQVIQTYADAEIIQQGQVVVPAKELSQLANRLPKQPVTFEAKDEKLAVTYGKGEANLPTFPVDDYPQIPEVEGEPHKLTADPAWVSFAASQNDSLPPAFTGVFLDLEGGYMVATDVHRMAVQEIAPREGGGTAIIPAKFTNMLAGGEISIVLNNNMAKAITGDAVYYTRLIAGKYPDWRMPIPKDFPTKVEFGVVEMAEAINRCALLSPKDKTLKFEFDDGKVTLSANSEQGKIWEEVPCTIDGEQIELYLFAQHVLDALKYTEGTITLEISGALSPAVLRQGDWFCLLMPKVEDKNGQ